MNATAAVGGQDQHQGRLRTSLLLMQDQARSSPIAGRAANAVRRATPSMVYCCCQVSCDRARHWQRWQHSCAHACVPQQHSTPADALTCSLRRSSSFLPPPWLPPAAPCASQSPTGGREWGHGFSTTTTTTLNHHPLFVHCSWAAWPQGTPDHCRLPSAPPRPTHPGISCARLPKTPDVTS